MQKTKIVNHLGTLALLLILLNTSTIYTYYYQNIGYFFLIFGGLIALFLLFFVNKLTISDALFKILVFLTMIIIFGLLSTVSSSTLSLIFKILILFSLIYSFSATGIEFSSILLKVLKIFAIWALLNQFFFYTGLLNLLPVTATYQSWKPFNLYLFFFYDSFSGITLFGTRYMRMSAPFSEPGVLAVFLNMGMFISLWLTPKGYKRNCWILIFFISLLLCMSSWGLIMLLIQFLCFLIKREKVFLTICSAFIAVIIGILLISQKYGSFSYYDRLMDLSDMFNQAIIHLPIGRGLGESEEYTRIDAVTGLQYNMVGNYTGLLTPFLDFGIGSIYYYYLLILGARYFTSNKRINRYIFVSLLILMLGSLLTEPLSLSTIYLSILCNGVINQSQSKKLTHYKSQAQRFSKLRCK